MISFKTTQLSSCNSFVHYNLHCSVVFLLLFHVFACSLAEAENARENEQQKKQDERKKKEEERLKREQEKIQKREEEKRKKKEKEEKKKKEKEEKDFRKKFNVSLQGYITYCPISGYPTTSGKAPIQIIYFSGYGTAIPVEFIHANFCINSLLLYL